MSSAARGFWVWVFFPVIKRGLFQADFKVFDCCFLKAEDYPLATCPCLTNRLPGKVRVYPQEFDSSTEFRDFLPALTLSRAPSILVYLYLENVVASIHHPLQKKIAIKGETGPEEDCGGEIQLA